MSCFFWPKIIIYKLLHHSSRSGTPNNSEEPINHTSSSLQSSIGPVENFTGQEMPNETHDIERLQSTLDISDQLSLELGTSSEFLSSLDTLRQSSISDSKNQHNHSSESRPFRKNVPEIIVDQSLAASVSRSLVPGFLIYGNSNALDREGYTQSGLSSASKTAEESDVSPSSFRSYGYENRKKLVGSISQDEDTASVIEGGSMEYPDDQSASEHQSSPSVRNNTDTLEVQLWNVIIEWPKESSRYFLPEDELLQIINHRSIYKRIKSYLLDAEEQKVKELTNLVWRQHAPAYKLFTILLLVGEGSSIFRFLEEDLSDRDLPFTIENFEVYTRRPGKRRVQCIKDLKWNRSKINELSWKQWWPLAPIFKPKPDKVPHFDLEPCCPLPYIEDDESCEPQGSMGGFGYVWGVRIHAAHQFLYESTDRKNRPPWLAIKRLHSTKEEDFRSEVEMLKAFSNKRDTPHLIKLLATYKLNNQYHLIFPRARSNLRTYWKKITVPLFSDVTVRWVLRQCRGIASGLQLIHNYKLSHPKQSTFLSPGLHIDGGTQIFGRHGDIKPENILWSDEDIFDINKVKNPQGLLVIADFGLMEFHSLHSRSQVRPDHLCSSPTYEPPEFQLPNGKISRAYDIWSLGCVYLEFITWLVVGSDYLGAFHNARVSPAVEVVSDDRFFTIVDQGNSTYAVVRDAVENWFKVLRKSPRASPFILDFLDLVQHKMLLVEASLRIDISKLNVELCDMLERSESDPDYLTGPPEPVEEESQSLEAESASLCTLLMPYEHLSSPPPERTWGIAIPSLNEPKSLDLFPYTPIPHL